MTTKPKAQPIRLTFDGWGFNDLDDKFRSRFATLPHPLPLDDERCEFIVRAVNSHASHAALTEAAQLVIDRWESGDLAEAVRKLASAIAAAKGTV